MNLPSIVEPFWSCPEARPFDLLHAWQFEVKTAFGDVARFRVHPLALSAILRTHQVHDALNYSGQMPLEGGITRLKVSQWVIRGFDFDCDLRVGFPPNLLWIENDYVHWPVQILAPTG